MTTQERLEAAEQAYYDLVTGGSVRVYLDQNGERVEYVPANAYRLAAYIQDLKRQLGKSSVAPMQIWGR